MPALLRPVLRAAILLLMGCFAAIAPALGQTEATEAESAPAVVFAGRIAGDGETTRIFFDLDRKVDFEVFLMDNPRRIVIDSGSLLFRFADPSALDPRGVVSFLRYGAIARDRSRIVLTLVRAAGVSRMSVDEIEPGKHWRLVIDLNAIEEEEFARQAAAERERIARTAKPVVKGDRPGAGRDSRDKPVVVIDAGHGGIDSGAKGRNGLLEKDLTLTVAKLIAGELGKGGQFEVMLTREEDIFISLSDRVAFARRNGASLVISLHADSLRQSFVRGASIYTLSREASDELAHELAQSENMSDIAAGLDVAAQDDAVTDILAELTARETSVFSRSFSATLYKTLRDQINLIKNPQRSAAFAVLKAPEVPGVLLEMGYLSNAEDEKLLSDPQWQRSFSRLVAEAIRDYFTTHGN